jgi:NRAMP (natural resistance-associated macrophage protein)-like metal ion transporter
MRRLGSGLITGAADDDPSGIATYSQAGAQFRFALAWTLLLTTPLMIGIQLLSARIGWITGEGLAANINRVCPRGLTIALVALLVGANMLNIAADIAAMGEAVRLLAGGHPAPYVLGFGALCVVLQLWFPYERTVRLLKWLTLVLFAYVAVLLAVRVPWGEVAAQGLLPWTAWSAQFSARGYAAMVVAVLGTTISPYLFFWQAAQEVEGRRRSPLGDHTLAHPARERLFLRRIRTDTIVGMCFSNAVALCIVVAAGVTLHGQGAQVDSAAQAAQALRPVAGDFAFWLFALGIVGTGLLAVPVLAGSAAYAVSEVFGWRAGLSRGFQEARGFYAIIVAATVLGTLGSLLAVDPIAALVWSAIANGVIAVPIMVAMMAIGQSRRLMGRYVMSPRHRVLGWAATGVMALAVGFMGVSGLLGG